MEWLEEIGYFLATYGEKILQYLGITAGSVLGGISIWKVGNIVVNLIKMIVEKRYPKKILAIKKELVEEMKVAIKETQGELQNELIIAFNGLESKKQAKKQEIFEKIFKHKQEAEIVKQEIVEDVKAEIDNVSHETEEIEQETEKEEKIEIKAETKTENNIAMGD